MESFTDQALNPAFVQGTGIVGVVWYVLIAVSLWRVFSKAGFAGILALIPILNVFLLVKIAGYSAWAGLLYLIPIVGWVFSIFVALRLGERFGKGGAFSFFLLWVLAPIGYFVIGLGDARYRGRR